MIFRERLESMKKRKAEIEQLLGEQGTVQNQQLYQKLVRELAQLKYPVGLFEEYVKAEKELADLKQVLSEPVPDQEMKQLYEEEKKTLQSKLKQIETDIEDELFKDMDPNSGRDVIIEIRAGTGGEEAALFGADLYRMYSRFATDKGLKTEVLDSSMTGKGGVKEVTFSLSGAQAYNLMKYESGIHRVQRVPETESSGRIHTSAVTVAVLPEADESEVEIESKDLKIDVFRASGAGGQHVNKTESAVRITHIPTGFVVSCQDERSQHKNKAKAMRVLRARLYEFIQDKHHQELAKERKSQVGSGDRSGKIRTYNFHEQRVTDHRIGLTLHNLGDILDGHLDEIIQALQQDEKKRRMTDAA